MEIRRCPLCGSNCFDDLEVCYCCMHRFDGEAVGVEVDTSGCHPDEEVPEEARGVVDVGTEEELVHGGTAAGESAAECGNDETTNAEVESTEVVADAEADVAYAADCPKTAAFGPSIEQLAKEGGCIRIDIPLWTIASAMERASYVPAYTPAPVMLTCIADLPPAA